MVIMSNRCKTSAKQKITLHNFRVPFKVAAIDGENFFELLAPSGISLNRYTQNPPGSVSVTKQLVAISKTQAGSSGGRNGRVRLLFMALSAVLMSKRNLPSFVLRERQSHVFGNG